MRSVNLRVVFAVLLALILAPAVILAQSSSTATVSGTVTDPKGATVPSAAVELLDTATNESRSQATNDTGYYLFASVAPGSYKVVVKKDGFRTTAITVDVQVGKAATVDIRLEVGTVSQTVEVVAGAQVELQTQDASVGNVMEHKTLENIPSLARDATALLL